MPAGKEKKGPSSMTGTRVRNRGLEESKRVKLEGKRLLAKTNKKKKKERRKEKKRFPSPSEKCVPVPEGEGLEQRE